MVLSIILEKLPIHHGEISIVTVLIASVPNNCSSKLAFDCYSHIFESDIVIN